MRPYWTPPVSLRVETEAGNARLVVRDRGPGLAEAQWDKVGRRFVRSGAPDGTGLGLAIVRAVANRHGGELRFARTAEGRFEASMVLPLDREAPA